MSSNLMNFANGWPVAEPTVVPVFGVALAVAVHDARIVDQNQVIAYAVQRAKSAPISLCQRNTDCEAHSEVLFTREANCVPAKIVARERSNALLSCALALAGNVCTRANVLAASCVRLPMMR